MRKRSSLGFAVLLLSLGLAACDQNETPAATNPEPAPTQIEPAPIPPRTSRGAASAPRSASASRSARQPAAAPPAASVTEVRGSRVAAGERAMADRGYTRVRSQGGTTYWRNARTNRCVKTVTSGGRYTAVATVNARACRR